MAKSIESLGASLGSMRIYSGKISKEFRDLYRDYSIGFGQLLKRNAIQACYHLCTHCYADSFLQLSGEERSQLQSELKQAITDATTSIVSLLTMPIADFIKMQLASMMEDKIPEGAMVIDDSPEALFHWHSALEDTIEESLQELSKQLNSILHGKQILPENLPKFLLEASDEVEERTDAERDLPNIAIALERRKDDEMDEDDRFQGISRIYTIYLRRLQIEFGNAQVMHLRREIDRLSQDVYRLRRDYHKKERELQVAAAESAWRSSWFEE
jgi:hypothetical protein